MDSLPVRRPELRHNCIAPSFPSAAAFSQSFIASSVLFWALCIVPRSEMRSALHVSRNNPIISVALSFVTLPIFIASAHSSPFPAAYSTSSFAFAASSLFSLESALSAAVSRHLWVNITVPREPLRAGPRFPVLRARAWPRLIPRLVRSPRACECRYPELRALSTHRSPSISRSNPRLDNG